MFQTNVGVAILLVATAIPLNLWGRGGVGGGGGGARGGGGGGGFSGGHSPGGGGGFGGGAGGGFSGSHGPSGFGGAGPSFNPGGVGGPGQHPGGASFNPGGIGGAGRGPGGPGGANPGFQVGGPGRGPGGTPFNNPGAGGDRFASPSRNDLNSFLGLPAGDGMHSAGSFGVGKGNIGIGGDAGIGGGRPGVTPGGIGVGTDIGIGGGRPGVGVGGVGVGPNGIGVGRPGVGVGFNPISNSNRYLTGTAIRNNYNNWGIYNRDWYARYPGAWFATGWVAGSAWNTCTWSTAANYFGYTSQAPAYYDYGTNVTYQGDYVYMGDQPAATSQEYYNQATTIANTGATAQAPANGDWLPLGVFAFTKPGSAKSDITIQLAVNKEGIIRGNYTDTAIDKTQVVQGSVEKQTQRVAFTVGDHKSKVIETGLYNLTKDEAPVLLHVDADHTEQWLLVRLSKPTE